MITYAPSLRRSPNLVEGAILRERRGRGTHGFEAGVQAGSF